MSKSTSETDEFYAQIHRRMVESGEWDRILRLLLSKLSEHGWVDEMRHRAKGDPQSASGAQSAGLTKAIAERARSMDTPSFRAILGEISPPAQAGVPPAVKREVMNILRQYVKDQFEK